MYVYLEDGKHIFVMSWHLKNVSTLGEVPITAEALSFHVEIEKWCIHMTSPLYAVQYVQIMCIYQYYTSNLHI